MIDNALPHTQASVLNKVQIDYLLSQPLIARMATVNVDRPHIAPVWFLWDDGHLYIETDKNFQKAINLQRNPYCSVVVDDTLGGLRFWGVILQGKVELITEPEDVVLDYVKAIYTKYLGREGILAPTPQEMIFKGQHVIIKLTPEKMISWDDTHTAIAPIG
jgi:nitroimidazol reductase NimA-like FMN-containing flavoprotein (pyridoxamine 5'-phosphate oxidase superfamily)